MSARVRLQCLTCLRPAPGAGRSQLPGAAAGRGAPLTAPPSAGSGLEHGRTPGTHRLPVLQVFTLTSSLDTRAGAEQGFMQSFSSLCEFAL